MNTSEAIARHRPHQDAGAAGLSDSSTRRTFLGACGAAALAGAVPLRASAAQGAREQDARRAFRFVFLPDIHLMHDLRSPQGMEMALTAADRLDPRPDFLVTGGDLIDSLRLKNLAQATELADLFTRIWSANTDLPVHHMMGNHDPAGWSNDEYPREHPEFGYNLLQRRLPMPHLYYSFDYGAWHFVILHNIRLVEPGTYLSEFSEEQMTWLREDLSKHPERPTILFGHFPPVTATEFLDGRAKVQEGAWTLSTQRMSRNPYDLVKAVEGANIKAFLSGHIHRLDRVEVMGRTFICSGSVSGAKWRGHDHDTPEGITIVDCHPDGRFDYRYHDYGWNAAV
jgi:3',5'-cyclic AMP phosphodiesterase CpdA